MPQAWRITSPNTPASFDKTSSHRNDGRIAPPVFFFECSPVERRANTRGLCRRHLAAERLRAPRIEFRRQFARRRRATYGGHRGLYLRGHRVLLYAFTRAVQQRLHGPHRRMHLEVDAVRRLPLAEAKVQTAAAQRRQQRVLCLRWRHLFLRRCVYLYEARSRGTPPQCERGEPQHREYKAAPLPEMGIAIT